jgi:hypothetical protein
MTSGIEKEYFLRMRGSPNSLAKANLPKAIKPVCYKILLLFKLAIKMKTAIVSNIYNAIKKPPLLSFLKL